LFYIKLTCYSSKLEKIDEYSPGRYPLFYISKGKINIRRTTRYVSKPLSQNSLYLIAEEVRGSKIIIKDILEEIYRAFKFESDTYHLIHIPKNLYLGDIVDLTKYFNWDKKNIIVAECVPKCKHPDRLLN